VLAVLATFICTIISHCDSSPVNVQPFYMHSDIQKHTDKPSHCSKVELTVTTGNKKVSYCKKIARQHSCHQKIVAMSGA